jgi:hypothetical protein
MKPQYHQIPEELRTLPNWIVWRLEKRATKAGVVQQTKVPYNARSQKHAKSNDPATWSSFSDASEALKRGYNGLGFCLSYPYVGVDLDGCRGKTPEPWAQQILDELDSYYEASPSGNGIHVLVKGELPDGPRQKDFKDRDHHGVGLYDAVRGRYLTMTGWRLSRNGGIAERTAELQRIHARLFPPQAKAKTKAKAEAGAAMPDDDLIARARKANDGGKFSRLWDGRWEGAYVSQSEADLALCMKLAFWTGRDTGRIDALFRRSAMMREKWNRADYREATIVKAIEQTKEIYRSKKSWSPPQGSLMIAANAVEISIDTLNSMAIFHGRIEIQSVARRGSMIIATTANAQEIILPTVNDLISFAKARAAIAEGTAVLLPQPPKGQVSEIWDPAAQMILRLAERSAMKIEPVLKSECRDLLIQMWRYSKQPSAKNSEEFMEYLVQIRKSIRNRESPSPPCVFIAEGFCWVHVPTFRNWLSLPMLTNRLYPLADIRNGLLLLGFDYVKDVTRGHAGDEESASLWRGPVDVLLE